MYTVRPTQKLLTRLREPATRVLAPTTNILGDWYANALFWKPHVALFVNETTLLPVLLPLAPASTVVSRFPEALALILSAVGTSPIVIRQELAAMTEAQVGRTTNRTTLGVMVDMARHAQRVREDRAWNMVDLALFLAHGPRLIPNTIWPIDALHALVAKRALLS